MGELRRGPLWVIFHRGVYVSFRREPVVRSTVNGRFVPTTVVSRCHKVARVEPVFRVFRAFGGHRERSRKYDSALKARGLSMSIGSATQLTHKRGDSFRGQIGTLSEHGMTKVWKLNQRNAVGVIGFKRTPVLRGCYHVLQTLDHEHWRLTTRPPCFEGEHLRIRRRYLCFDRVGRGPIQSDVIWSRIALRPEQRCLASLNASFRR